LILSTKCKQHTTFKSLRKRIRGCSNRLMGIKMSYYSPRFGPISVPSSALLLTINYFRKMKMMDPCLYLTIMVISLSRISLEKIQNQLSIRIASKILSKTFIILKNSASLSFLKAFSLQQIKMIKYSLCLQRDQNTSWTICL
jgi:hypothetical protein